MRRPALSPRAPTAVALAAATLLALAPPVSASPPGPGYAPPVDAPVIDEFRPPPDRFSAGNRGVDYAVLPDDSVRAAADGVVTFAGSVGASLHVVVLHADGVRTSYSFLGTASVRRGQRVVQGDIVGTTSVVPLHFGARVGDEYIDPLALLASPRPRVRLVPDDGKGLPPESGERGALERLVRATSRFARFGRVPARLAAWAGGRTLPVLLGVPSGDTLRLARELATLLPDPDLAGLVATLVSAAGNAHPGIAVAAAVGAHLLARGPCTPSSEPEPAPPPGRRLAVLVAGLGSSSTGKPSITDLRTDLLGYAGKDVFQFSYRGGHTRRNHYGSIDTQADPVESGRRLRTLLDELAAKNPGVPIDVFAHSLGGLVARSALTQTTRGTDPPPVEHLVTFGTPHDGADLATVADAAQATLGGRVAAAIAAKARPMGLDPTRPVVDALSPGSTFVRSLQKTPLPPTVKATSIATRRDVVVPAPRSWLKGATNVVVPSRGVNAHSTLPGSPEARREAALALAGRPPTCEPLLDAALDAAAASAVQLTESAVAVGTRTLAGARTLAGTRDRATWAPPVG